MREDDHDGDAATGGARWKLDPPLSVTWADHFPKWAR